MTPRCPALPLRLSPPTAVPQPLCRAGRSRAATHPAQGRENSAGRSSAPRQVCGAAVRGVRGGRGRAASEASGTRQVAVPAAAPLGEVSAGGARLACSGRAVGRRRPREAALTAGCRRSALRLPSTALRRRRAPRPRPPGPGGSENAESGLHRGIQAARRAPTRTPARPGTARSLPGSGGRAGAGQRGRACGRAASWAGLAGQAAGGAERGAGYLRDEVHRGAAQVLKCGLVVSSAPPPILCSLPPFLTNNPDGLKDRKSEGGKKTNPISSDQMV